MFYANDKRLEGGAMESILYVAVNEIQKNADGAGIESDVCELFGRSKVQVAWR